MKYKVFFLSFFLSLLCNTVIGQAAPQTADEILNDAYKQAATEKKKVFILFHASWCGWCDKMDAAMNDPLVEKFFTDNYVVRHMVVYESNDKKKLENPGAEDLLKKYKGNDQGIPYWLIFDKDGKMLADSKIRPEGGGLETGDNSGCPASEKEVEHFVKVLENTSSLKPAQLEIIRKRFRENEN